MYLFALLFSSVASFFKTMFLKKFNDQTLLNSQYQLRISIPLPAQRLGKWFSVGFNPVQLQKCTKIIIIILRDSCLVLSSVVSHTLNQHVSTGHPDQGRLHWFSRGHSLIFPLDARANTKCNLSPQNHSPKFKYKEKLKIMWWKDNHLTRSWWLGNVYGHTLPRLAAPLSSLTRVASEPFPTGELHITALTAPLQFGSDAPVQQ